MEARARVQLGRRGAKTMWDFARGVFARRWRRGGAVSTVKGMRSRGGWQALNALEAERRETTRRRGTDRDVFTTAAVQQDFQGEEDFGEEGEAKPPASPMDPYAYGQQDSVRLLSGFLTARDSTRPARAPVRAHLFPFVLNESIDDIAFFSHNHSYNAKRRHWRRTKLNL